MCGGQVVEKRHAGYGANYIHRHAPQALEVNGYPGIPASVSATLGQTRSDDTVGRRGDDTVVDRQYRHAVEGGG